MKCYMKALREEREAFWMYMDMAAEDDDNKADLRTMAADELEHFKKVIAMVWKKDGNYTELEKEVWESFECEAKKMQQHLDK